MDIFNQSVMKLLAFFVFVLLQAGAPPFHEIAEHSFDGSAQVLFVADLDNDGTEEIVVWDAVAGEVICHDFKGAPLWTLEASYPVVTAAAEDLDDDGSREIFLLEEVGGDTNYVYWLIRMESDGTPSWRKRIEISVQAELEFRFVNADGKPGKEILIANRVLLGGGLERLAFEWDRIIIGAEEHGGTCYFLVHVPEESYYELYNFDAELVWKGSPCEITDTKASTEVLLCDLFMRAGVCSCFEDWTLESVPLTKSVRLWSDLTGDGNEEAIYYTDTVVQLIDHQGDLRWTWESPEYIEDLMVLEMTGDACTDIVVLTPQRPHVPSLYVLDCTGSIQSIYALNLSGTPTVLFSDLDGDGDSDLLTFDRKKRGSTLRIYANTLQKGPLDAEIPLGSLTPVDPTSVKIKFWTFYAEHGMTVLAVAGLIVIVVGIAVMMRRKRTRET